MPSSAQKTILGAFNQVSATLSTGGSTPGAGTGLSSASTDGLTEALTEATQVIDAQTQATSANTDALAQDSQTRNGGGTAGAVSDAVSAASQFLGGGLSLMPLASLFSSLFGGGQSQPAPLVPYSLPPSLSLQSTTNYQSVDWGENGVPRAAGGGMANAPSNTPQITVQVQAMDSQSFLDHSADIAQAVRQAMLNMNSLNDVITNL